MSDFKDIWGEAGILGNQLPTVSMKTFDQLIGKKKGTIVLIFQIMEAA